MTLPQIAHRSVPASALVRALPRGRSRARRALLAILSGLLAGALGCAPEAPRPSVSLLPIAGPVSLADGAAEGGETAAPPSRSRRFAGVPEPWALHRPGRLRLGSSERLAVVTTPEVAWEMPVALDAGDRLVLSAAHLRVDHGEEGGAGDVALEPASGRLLLVAEDGGERTLGHVEAAPGDWVEFELRIPEAGEGRLRLASPAGPMAWAGVLLVRDRAAAPARPNIVLVSVDTLRADRLAAYGAERPVAPNLDRFAAGCLVFESSLSTSTWTLPSHASMFTGLLPDQHGLLSHHDRLPGDLPTVARRLAEVGYHTVGITDGGFLHPRWGLASGFDRWDWTEGHPWEPKDVRVVVERARAWMEANRFEPYFLFVHTYETHQPYVNREGFADPFLPPGGGGADRLAVFELSVHPTDPDERRLATALYDGGVARMDHHLGGWLLELAESGRLEGTAVVITSDHGEELGEHGGYEHGVGKVFDENLRVPLVVRTPGGDGVGVASTPTTSLDLAPTLLAWAGASDPSLPGRPLPELAAEPDPSRPVLAHGVNSLADLNERRYRLDRGDHTLVLDRVRSTLRSFDRGRDSGMQRPRMEARAAPEGGDTAGALPAPTQDAALGLARLQAILAWAEGGGAGGGGEGWGGDRLAVALPPKALAVEAGAAGAVVPRGVWDGVVWRPVRGASEPMPLGPALPALLTFDLRPGSRPRELFLWSEDRGAGDAQTSREALALREARWTADPGWNPIDGRLPGPGEIFRTAGRGAPATLELDDEARRELRALGYLQ